MIASALLLVAATAMSVGFLLVRGSFDLPGSGRAGPTAGGGGALAEVGRPVADRDDRIPASWPGPRAQVACRDARNRAARDGDPGAPRPTPGTDARARHPASNAQSRTDGGRLLLLVPCPNAARLLDLHHPGG